MPKEKSDLKQEQSWKNNLFSRYMLFRYSLALFFFANLYWIMILLYKQAIYLLLPIIMNILIVIACAEQFKLYGQKEVNIPWTKRAFKSQILISGLAILIAILPNQMSIAFPVFADNLYGILFVAIMQLLGALISFYNLKRANRVEKNTDKFYYRFQQSFGDIL